MGQDGWQEVMQAVTAFGVQSGVDAAKELSDINKDYNGGTQAAPIATAATPTLASGTSVVGKLVSAFKSAVGGGQTGNAGPVKDESLTIDTPWRMLTIERQFGVLKPDAADHMPAHFDIPAGSTAAYARELALGNLEHAGLTKDTADKYLNGDPATVKAVDKVFAQSPELLKDIHDVRSAIQNYSPPQGTAPAASSPLPVTPARRVT